VWFIQITQVFPITSYSYTKYSSHTPVFFLFIIHNLIKSAFEAKIQLIYHQEITTKNTKLDFCIQKYYNEENVLFNLVRMSSLSENQANSWNISPSSHTTPTQKIRNIIAAATLSLTAWCVTITTKPPQVMWMDQERFAQRETTPSQLEHTAFRNIYPAIQNFQNAVEENPNDNEYLQAIKNQILGEAELLSHENVYILARYFSDKSQQFSGDAKKYYINLSSGMYLIAQKKRTPPSPSLWNSSAFSPDILPPKNARQNITEQREYQERPIDLRIIRWSAKIHGKDYILDARASIRPIQIGPDMYELQLPFRRDSRSSLRGDEIVTLRFKYDGYQLSFFWDKNRNGTWDRHEDARIYTVSHTEEIVRQWNRIFRRNAMIPVHLDRKHVSSSQRVNDLSFEIILK